MTKITIPLTIGENYISFPEYSTSSFRQIFTDSGMINNVVKMERYDTITNTFQLVDLDLDAIHEARGYVLTIKPTTYILPIIYNGISFPIEMTFDILTSMLFNGWNFVGTDNNIINVSNWCTCIDATSGIKITQILPTKAYWINSSECSEQPKDYTILISTGLLALFFYDIVLKKK